MYEWRCEDPHCPLDVFEVKLTMQQIEEGYTPDCPCCGREGERVYSRFGGKFGDTERFHA